MSAMCCLLSLMLMSPYVLGVSDDVLSYLQDYGYVHYESIGAHSFVDLNSSIECARSDLGLPITSVIDEDFLKLISMKRCGNPPLSTSTRLRRYAFIGGRLRHAPITVCLHPSYLDPTIKSSIVMSCLTWITNQIASFTKATFEVSWCDPNNALPDIKVLFAPTIHDCVANFSKHDLAHALNPLSSRGALRHL